IDLSDGTYHNVTMSLVLQAQTLGPDVKLHLGCGVNVLPGWLNTDRTPAAPHIDYLDCAQPLPFHDNSIAAVFNEHMIEHIEKPRALAMIQEVFRVLRPHGLFRVVTPCMENFA